ncbi:MAG: ABC transporter substrate-binding protein [Firmicutes bacterium]|nr:ABC transporter substrate-binding protein [Bacillota bacterium]
MFGRSAQRSGFTGSRLLILLIVGLLLVGVGLTACKKQTTGKQGQLKKIIVSYPSVADNGDVPSLLAWELMRAQGYEVVPKFFAKTELGVEAVLRGDAHIGNTGGQTLYAAIVQGAPMKAFVLQHRNNWVLAGRGATKTLEALDGKKLAHHSPGAQATAMTNIVFAQKAPNIKPQVLLIQGSENRADAMLRGEIDATPLEFGDIVRISMAKPGEFNVLVSFADDLPWLQAVPFFARTDYLKSNAKDVKAVIKAILEVHRRMAVDPEYYVEQAPKFLPGAEEDVLKALHELDRKYELYPVNGGLEPEGQAKTTEFFVNGKQLPEGTKPDQLFDRSLLDEVLKEIGTK